MIVYTVTGTVGQAGYLDIANSGDITGKNIYVNMTNRCPCNCVFFFRQISASQSIRKIPPVSNDYVLEFTICPVQIVRDQE